MTSGDPVTAAAVAADPAAAVSPVVLAPSVAVAPPAADGPDEGVAATVRRAIGWSVLNTLVGRVGTAFVGIALAHVLVPADYGVFAVSLVALNALLAVNELGVSLAVVRWPGDRAEIDRIAPTVVTLSLASSLVLWRAVMAGAGRISAAMNAPQAADVLRLLSVGVLVDAATAVPSALMTRYFMQKQRLWVDAAGFVLTSALTLGLAVAGAGAWSLAVGALAGNLLNAVLILRVAPRRHAPGLDPVLARELLGFGLPLALASLLVFALLNVDYMIVGAHTTPAELGFYLLAFNLSSWPVNVISAPARRVSLPAFARLEADGGGASAAFVPSCAALVAATGPACLLGALLAGPLVALVYGDTWNAAAAVLPWLMVLAGTRAVGELAYDFLVALDRSRAALGVQAAWLAASVPAMVVGVRLDGIRGVAMAHAAVCLGVALPGYALVLRRAGVRLPDLAGALARPVAGLLLGAAAGLAASAVPLGDLGRVLLGGVAISAAYLAAVYPMRRLFLGADGSHPAAPAARAGAV